jgi:DNA repair proteins
MSGFVLSDDFVVPMVEIVYRPHVRLSKRPAISSFSSAGLIFYYSWNKESAGVAKALRIMLLGRAYEVLGIYELFDSVDAIVADPRKMLLAALRTNAYAICIARNDCGQGLTPNNSDTKLLNKAIQVARLFKIDVWDYVIVGKTEFFSFRKHGLLGNKLINDTLLPRAENTKIDFVKRVSQEIDISGIVAGDATSCPAKDPSKHFEVSSTQLIKSEKIGETTSAADISSITNHLLDFVQTLSNRPSLLKGRVRRLKIMSATRGYTVQNELYQDVYMTTSRIYLIGDWIAKTGLNCHDRIKVIPMHRLLIIAPDENKE